MSTGDAVQLAREAMMITLLLSAPMLGIGLLVGLIISVLQAVTQINEMTLSFIPKVLAVILAFVIFLPWLIRVMVDFTVRLLTKLPFLIR